VLSRRPLTHHACTAYSSGVEKADYLALLLERAQTVVARHEEKARALSADEFLVDLDGEIGAMVQDVMRTVPHPAHVILHTESSPGGFWKEADDWEGALFRAAFDCFEHDLRSYVLRILRNELPRSSELK